jgi:hypothetical protein
METQAYLVWFAAGIFIGMLAGIRWSFDHSRKECRTSEKR